MARQPLGLSLAATTAAPWGWWLLCACAAPLLAWGALQAGLGCRLARTGSASVWLLLVLAPVLEETVLRWAWQRNVLLWLQRVRAWPAGAAQWGAGLSATLVFALVHVPRVGWLPALWWSLPGAALAYSWHRWPRTWGCICLHAWFNLSWMWSCGAWR